MRIVIHVKEQTHPRLNRHEVANALAETTRNSFPYAWVDSGRISWRVTQIRDETGEHFACDTFDLRFRDGHVFIPGFAAACYAGTMLDELKNIIEEALPGIVVTSELIEARLQGGV